MAGLPSFDERSWLRIGPEQGLELYGCAVGADAQRRQPFETLIATCFAEHYGAQLRQFMPCLLGLKDVSGQLQAVAGLRSAAAEPLFLERYLSEPIEQAVARQRETPALDREQLVEVGNLAARGAGQARLLIVALTQMLALSGIRWVAFTGTSLLLNSFQRLGVTLLNLGAADGRCLGSEQADWGSYYATHPQVMVGDVLAAHQRLQTAGVYQRLGCRSLRDAEQECSHVAC